jgi:hypothetical protein
MGSVRQLIELQGVIEDAREQARSTFEYSLFAGSNKDESGQDKAEDRILRYLEFARSEVEMLTGNLVRHEQR